MAEKDKSSSSEQFKSSATIRNPSKEQIVTRLVQIRNYISKAEETLDGMSPYLRSDPKFFQLHDMISELRETEKRLMEMLRDYDAAPFQHNKKVLDIEANIEAQLSQPFSSNNSNKDSSTEEPLADFSMYGASSSNGIAPELFGDRDKVLVQRDVVNKQSLASQIEESLEEERSFLRINNNNNGIEKLSSICSPKLSKAADVDLDKRLQLELARESSDSNITRRCQSAGGQPMTEEFQESDLHSRNLSELNGKRYEIHNIMSEIALLRRAKDESSRKIDLLQLALSETSSNPPEKSRSSDFVPWTKEKKDEENLQVPKVPSQRNEYDCTDLVAECSEWSESFQKSFTGKLLEIQAMREKLENLQSLVHSIPSPNPNYQLQSLDSELEELERSSTRREPPKDLNSNEFRDRICHPGTGITMRQLISAPSNALHNFQSRMRSQTELPMHVPALRDFDRMLNSSEMNARAVEEALNLPADIRNAFRHNEDFIQNLGNQSDSSSRRDSDYSCVGMEMDGRKADTRASNKMSSRHHLPLDHRDEYYRLQQTKVNQNNQYPSSSEPHGHSSLYKLQECHNYSNPALNSSVKSSSGQNLDQIFPLRSMGGSNDGISSLRSQKQTTSGLPMTVNDKNSGSPDYMDSVWNWDSNLSGQVDNSHQRKYQSLTSNNNNAFTDRYMSETSILLKHLVDSVNQISNDLSSQKSQLNILNLGMTKLTDRVEHLLLSERLGPDPRNFLTERNSSAPPNLSRSNQRRSHGSANDELVNENSCYRDMGFPFYPVHQNQEKGGYSRDLLKGRHSQSTGIRSSNQVNPLREMWVSPPNLVNNSNFPSSGQRFRDESSEQPSNLISVSMHGMSNNSPNNNNSSASNHVNPRRWNPISPSSSSLWTSPQPMLNNSNNNNQDQNNGSASAKRPWASPNSSSALGTALNNQVPPGNRTNNYWDNFRSQSRQNVLSSSSKSNESSNSVGSANPEVNQLTHPPPSLTNNHSRQPHIHDKGKPIKGVWMNHFVENIGSKKRNQEQQRQSLPQRSVSAGSIQHENGGAIAGPSHINRRNRVDELNNYPHCFGMNKPMRQDEYNALSIHPLNKFEHPEEPKAVRHSAHHNQQHSERNLDSFTDMFQKVSQLKDEYLRMKTIDAVRKVVAQSMRQDEMTGGCSSGESSTNGIFAAEMNVCSTNSRIGNSVNAQRHDGCARDNSNSPVLHHLSDPDNDLLGNSNINHDNGSPADQYLPPIIASFHAAQKSIAEAQKSSSSSSQSRIMDSNGARISRSVTTNEEEDASQQRRHYKVDSEDSLIDNVISSSVSAACKGDSYFDYECDLESGDSSFQTAVVSTIPIRDTNDVQQDMDDSPLESTLFAIDSKKSAAKTKRHDQSAPLPQPHFDFSSLLERVATNSTSNSSGYGSKGNERDCSYEEPVISASNNPWTRNSDHDLENIMMNGDVRHLNDQETSNEPDVLPSPQIQASNDVVPNENAAKQQVEVNNSENDQVLTEEENKRSVNPK